MVQDYGLFIGGKWKKSEGKRFETRNPATGEVLATFPLATKEELGDTVPSELPDKMCLTVRMPVGPAGLITPWNFPMAIPGWKSGAALIAGCPFILKPSSLTPLCAAKFVEVLDEAGFPPGVVNML